jgi:hypothetical protein
MPVQRFLISGLTSGLQRNKDAWLIMDDAWATLENVHVWREKVIKRFGCREMNSSKSGVQRQLFSRLRLKIGTTDAVTGNFTLHPVPGAIFKIGQLFSVGDTIFTVYQNGATYTTGAATATYNTATGDFDIVGNNENPLTDVYFYPAEPVMLLPSYENAAINDETLIAFDTQFAYIFSFAAGWQCLGPVPPAAGSGIWTGDDANFHWATNYRGPDASDYILFVVNGVVADQIQYWDGTNWTQFEPVYDTVTGFVIRTGKIILPFHDRLLLLNTIEETAAGDRSFVNRIRYSQNGDPTDAANGWDETVEGRGDAIDLPTREAIISAQPLKDTLIIYCERSTWALEYNGNQAFPFRYRQINSELGVESQNSTVLFDKYVIGMGSTGVHACNNMNVERADDMIPDNVFTIANSNAGPERVCGVRDYFTEEVYWSYTSTQQTGNAIFKFPNKVMVFNYKTGAWALNDDSITAFGYVQEDRNVTWADLTTTWANGDEQWADPSDIALFRNVVGGNQEGFTFIVDHTRSSNASSLQITDLSVAVNIITIKAINHNLALSDAIYIEGLEGFTGINDTIYIVQSIIDADRFTIQQTGTSGTYEGGGTITLVSRIYMVSKQYNFFNDIGKKIHIPRIDFLVDTQEDAFIQFNYMSSFSNELLDVEGNISGAGVGDFLIDFNPLTTYETSQTKVWRPIFPLLEGSVGQYILTMTNPLLLNTDSAFADFRLHAIIFYARPTSDFGT